MFKCSPPARGVDICSPVQANTHPNGGCGAADIPQKGGIKYILFSITLLLYLTRIPMIMYNGSRREWICYKNYHCVRYILCTSLSIQIAKYANSQRVLVPLHVFPNLLGWSQFVDSQRVFLINIFHPYIPKSIT